MRIHKYIYRIATLILSAALFASCYSEPARTAMVVPEGTPVDYLIHFGSEENLDLTVSTKSTVDEIYEAKVWNLYVFIFDSQGRKLNGKYFDSEGVSSTENAATSSSDDAWYVNNSNKVNNHYSPVGTVKIKTTAQTGCSIYMIANVNSDMVNISPEYLATIQSETEAKTLIASLNQQLITRTGLFPMSGKLSNVDTTVSSDYWSGTEGSTLWLRHLDAKIRVWVHIDPSTNIESFEPTGWYVANVPTDSYIFDSSISGETSDSAKGYFTSDTRNFEDTKYVSTTVSGVTKSVKYNGFSFYMLENKSGAKSGKTASNFNDRDKEIKNNGANSGSFEYASDSAPYIVLTGRLVMNNASYTVGEISKNNCVLSANVQYSIHLGDIATSMNDFNVKRNTSYTYNITIKGVNDIKTEVEVNNDADKTNDGEEDAPAAEGEVTIALEEIFTSDAHYSSHCMKFDAQYIVPERLNWYVSTPFSEGNPINVNGTLISEGLLDDKWVEFRVNKMKSDGTYYEQKRATYLPHGKTPEDGGSKSMYVNELIQFIKEEYEKYHNNLDNAFDKNGCIYVTAFVNEYYYEKNPITGLASTSLWKTFVNQPMRKMHILSDYKTSLDGDSSIIGSSITIQQKSIQTIYNTSVSSLMSGWGCEHEDEFGETLGWYADTDTRYNGNTSTSNGRLNSTLDWGLASGTTFKTTKSKWDTYMNFQVENSYPELNDAHANLRYSCMMRNRDNNGDGYIDEDEIRWYTAAIDQLTGLFEGADALDEDARLYTRDNPVSGNMASWAQHIVSSTAGSNDNSGNPVIFWAEEGLSTGNYLDEWNDSYRNYKVFSVRCVRNLGYDEAGTTEMTHEPINVTPETYASGTYDSTDGSYTFDLTKLDPKCIRGYTTSELTFGSERSESNKLYWKFKLAPTSETFSEVSFTDMNANLDKLTTNPYCPEGYRLPNQREVSIMRYFTPGGYSNSIGDTQIFTRIYFSLGSLDGYGLGITTSAGMAYASGRTYNWTPGERGVTTARCVKDVVD